jgi:gluconokinase
VTALTRSLEPFAEVDHIVVMGVSGSRKSTVAALLAERLGRDFAEADLFHSPANRAKMSAGRALDDADREPWLACLRDRMTAHYSAGRLTVLACSALRRRYRDVLREAEGSVVMVHLAVPRQVLAARMQQRTGHYMPTSLLVSQLDSLEPLGADERGVVIDGTAPLAQVIDQFAAALAGETSASAGHPGSK